MDGSCVLLAVAVLLQPGVASLRALYVEALELQEKKHGQDHPQVARAAKDLGLFLRSQGDRRGAEPYLRRALEIDERVFGTDSAIAGEDLENLASLLPAREALPLRQRAATSKDPSIAARNLAWLAMAEQAQGRTEESLELYRKALAKEEEAGADSTKVAVRLNDVGLLAGPREAEPLFRRALAIQERKLGPRHPETAVTASNLASVLVAQGRLAQAEPLARRAYSALAESMGPNQPRVATAASNLADLLRAKKDYPGARKYYQLALDIDRKAYGNKHPEVAVDLENLAELLEVTGRAGEAKPLRREAAEIKGAR